MVASYLRPKVPSLANRKGCCKLARTLPSKQGSSTICNHHDSRSKPIDKTSQQSSCFSFLPSLFVSIVSIKLMLRYRYLRIPCIDDVHAYLSRLNPLPCLRETIGSFRIESHAIILYVEQLCSFTFSKKVLIFLWLAVQDLLPDMVELYGYYLLKLIACFCSSAHGWLLRQCEFVLSICFGLLLG